MSWRLQIAVLHPAWAMGTRLWPSAGVEALLKDEPFLQHACFFDFADRVLIRIPG